MLNFRKLRQDFSSSVLKEGKDLFGQNAVLDAKILHIDGDTIRLSSRVKGTFENVYEGEIEIDRSESALVDSNCDCTYTYDCQHIAALLHHLEKNLDQIIVAYSEETDLEEVEEIDEVVKQELRETFEEATTKEEARKGEHFQKEVLNDYVIGAHALSSSPFFLEPEIFEEEKAEMAVILSECDEKKFDVQLAVRLPYRSKPLSIPNIKGFIEAIRYREVISIGGKRYFFTPESFSPVHRELFQMIADATRFYGSAEEKYQRVGQLSHDALGMMIAKSYDRGMTLLSEGQHGGGELPCLYWGNLEEPIHFSTVPAHINFKLEYLEAPAPTLMMRPSLTLDEATIALEEARLFESTKPGVLHNHTYYRFSPKIKRCHLRALTELSHVAIPQPLFGTFIENSLPVLRKYAKVTNPSLINRFSTLPYVEEPKGRCAMHYLNGELEAEVFFLYDGGEIPAATTQLKYEDVARFAAEEGMLARSLVEEKKILDAIFDGFLFDEKEGVFRAKSEKKIVEFMTEVIPKNQHRIEFECPENLSDQFIYDESTFELAFRECERVDAYEVELKVDGYLKGTSLDLLWDCVTSNRRFLELQGQKGKGKGRIPRILVLDLEKIAPLVQIFDEIGLDRIENYVEERPLWSLTAVGAKQFSSLPVKFSMTKRLKQIQKQILGESSFSAADIPKEIQAKLRNYQVEGVEWLERLRKMHLNGVLADDMGLGKTLQAITAITQHKKEGNTASSLIVCPTSLVYNWKEEFHKFHPKLKILVVDGTPERRKKLLKKTGEQDVIITSYNLLQKDVEIYKKQTFDYLVLDEAHHIKNRGTRNAKSVKMIEAKHRLILTGTPIENSLDELWSLFDFLMPGLLSSYDRFVEKYIRNCGQVGAKTDNLKSLQKKVSPFILRRMKEDVLEDLPPVSEILYHCHLTETQQELYKSYAASAKEELSKLVKKEGFEKVQIHVLATLTRLKQICCHPAIFAKDKVEMGDSAKYDLLMELLPSLIDGGHKTVLFSQYTKMLSILREDFEHRGIPFAYLDGSSKNRLSIVKQFNEDPNIPVFLVSLKAGGSGLNLVGADTVIHYDMWWNPAVENQATDRVHRIGQQKSVSSYKLVTLNTIEEKILNLQNRKKGLVKKVISTDDEAISKLTWEEVLELLQT